MSPYICFVQGNILYRFPSLQITASSRKVGRKEYVGRKWADWVGGIERYFREKQWQFRFSAFLHMQYTVAFSFFTFTSEMLNVSLCSKTSSSETAMVIGLGGLNLFGVVVLGTMLKYVINILTLLFIFQLFPVFSYNFMSGYVVTCRNMMVAPSGFITFVSNIFPLLQV